jgi:Gluconate 2-dehydrogenase subunit 3
MHQPVPYNPETNQPIGPVEQPGYYPGYRTMDQQSFWDAATRRTVLQRVSETPSIQFFSAREAELLEVICDHLLPQSDRVHDRHIPIVPFIDNRLYSGRTPGYRHEDMPADGDAYKLGLGAVEQMAAEIFHRSFFDLDWSDQEQILKSIHDAKPAGARQIWERMPVERFWMLLVQDCVEVYYAHPWAWDEIGFGGPAYPRGYVRLENGEPEPWEVEEQRYTWAAPPEALSDPANSEVSAHRHHPAAGQSGTH